MEERTGANSRQTLTSTTLLTWEPVDWDWGPVSVGFWMECREGDVRMSLNSVGEEGGGGM